jgi:GMP synthase (glutamine-hydrolysing)
VIRHVAYEGLGLLGPPLRRRGVRGVRLDVFRGDPVPRTLPAGMMLVVLGGPYNVRDAGRFKPLAAEMKLLEDALARGAPVLGVGLGAALLARAAGGKVYRAAAPELGWSPVALTAEGQADPVTAALPPHFVPLQWRIDEIAPPTGARILARSEATATQAFAVGPRAYGLAFHLEPTTSMIRAWLRVHHSGLPSSDDDRMRLLRDTPLHIGALPGLCDTFVARFLDRAFAPLAPTPAGPQDDLESGRGVGR